jgi:hypothetical protein
MKLMDDRFDEGPPPTGYEPPTDVNVPWFAWVIWPVALIAALTVCSVVFKGCLTFIT